VDLVAVIAVVCLELIEGADDGSGQGVDALSAGPDHGARSVGQLVIGNLEEANVNARSSTMEDPAVDRGFGFELGAYGAFVKDDRRHRM
jgi:hypothetical protein